MRHLLIAAVALLSLAAAAGEAERDSIAVVDVEVEAGALGGREARRLSEQVRSLVGTNVDLRQLTVVTRDNLELMLAEGEKLESLQDQPLPVIGRKLQARYVAGGKVGRAGGELQLTLELYEVRSAALLATRQGAGADARALERTLPTLVRKLLEAAAAASDGALALGAATRGTIADFDGQLERALSALLADVKAPGRRTLAVAIDKVTDDGIPGDRRAEWLRERAAAALSRHQVQVRELPRRWNPQEPLPGVGVVLQASIFSHQVGDEAMLEVSWRGLVPGKGGATLRTAERMVFPAELAPGAPGLRVEEVPSVSAGLSIRLDADASGSLCPGEVTRLTVSSEEPRFIQVFNLYGKDRALLLYPDAQETDGKVPASRRISIGGACGVQAIPLEGSGAERFLVLGADTREALGPTARFRAPCRLSKRHAALLWNPARLPPGVAKAQDGFRITTSPRCELERAAWRFGKTATADTDVESHCAPVTDLTPDAVEKLLQGIPECGP